MRNKPRLNVELQLTEQQECDLIRFHETCEDSQPYDVSKEGMKSLARIGLVRSLGFKRYEVTDAGGVVVEKLRTLLDKPSICAESQVEPAIQTPFDAAVKMCSDVDSYRKRRPHLPIPGRGSLHNACIALYHKGYRLPDEQLALVAVVPPELNDDLRYIFGMMCFQCITYAQALRGMGHSITNKVEDEQAATIHWMYGHYLRDPDNWRTNAIAEIKAAKLAAKQQ